MHLHTSKLLAAAASVGLFAQVASALTVTSGLVYHLDAGAGVTLSGGNVSQWNDQSGNGRNFVQGTADKQPLFVAADSLFNNRPTIRFDGNETGNASGIAPVSDELNLNSSVSIRTVFIVNRTTRHDGLDGIWGINGQDNGIRRENAASWQHPGNTNDFSNTGALRVNGATTDLVNLNVAHILAATRSSNLTMSTTSIGDYFQSGTVSPRAWQGEVAEVIAYDRALTERETQRVEGELALKYGVLGVRTNPIGIIISGLRGGDLTDPQNDGNKNLTYDPNTNQFAGFNAIFRSNNEDSFSNTAETAFNAFDNSTTQSGKWCCDGASLTNPLRLDAEILDGAYFLTSFTLTSSNDSPERDPRNFSILGSNDGTNFDVLFNYDNEFGTLFTARNQTILFEAGFDFAEVATAYKIFRYEVTGTGGSAHAIAEIEYFGNLLIIPEPMTAGLTMMVLGALSIRTGRRSRLA